VTLLHCAGAASTPSWTLPGTRRFSCEPFARRAQDVSSTTCFVSSISVYRAFLPGRHYDEGAPRLEGKEGYGALKARAEEAIEEAMPAASP